MATPANTDYGALSGLERLIGFIVSLATSIFVSWVRKGKSGIASPYVSQAQKISIIATAVFLVIAWGFWANSDHLFALSAAAGTGILSCLVFYLLHVWIVEKARGAPRTSYILAFIATYVIYTFCGSSGLSSAGLFATVVLGNPANKAAAVKTETYEVLATLHGTRNVTENQLVPFFASSGQVNVGCDQTASSVVRWQLPPGAKVDGVVQPRWEATDNVRQVTATPASIADGVVSAGGSITGLNKQNFAFGISNCPGGGHGQLVIHGEYIASVTHSEEQPPLELTGEVNSKDRTVTLAIPNNSPDFHIDMCSVKLVDKISMQTIDSADLSVAPSQSTTEQKSAHGRFSAVLSGQSLRVDLLQ